MEKIKIIKIKKDNTFIPCNFSLYPYQKKIEGQLSLNQLQSFFYMPDNSISIPQQDVTLEDENGLKYFCSNCIFSIKLSFENLNIKLSSVSIDYICINSENKIDELLYKKLEVNFLMQNPDNIYLTNFSFKLNQTTLIEIKSNSIIISSNINVKQKYLWNIFINIYELLYLYIGKFLTIETIFYTKNTSEKLQFICELPNKYKPQKKACIIEDSLVNINYTSINKVIINKWKKLRKETLLVYDVFLQSNNSDDLYKENKVCMLLQCMEGFYNCTNTKAKKFWEIIEESFNKKR